MMLYKIACVSLLHLMAVVSSLHSSPPPHLALAVSTNYAHFPLLPRPLHVAVLVFLTTTSR